LDRAAVAGLTAVTCVLLVLADRAPLVKYEGDVATVPCESLEVQETRWTPYQKAQLVHEHYAFTQAAHRLEWDDWSNTPNGHWYSRMLAKDLETAQERAGAAKDRSHFDSQLAL